ncbi:prealbumin-like fold domain-containing protein [Arcanobacterium hippocoleae]
MYELTENDEKAEKYITLDGKTYKVVPKVTEWQAEEKNVYSYAYDNSLVTVVTVEKEWKGKDGAELTAGLPTAAIDITAANEAGKTISESHDFNAETKSNKYYISAAFNKYSFKEGNVALQLDQQVEVAIDGRTFLATLSKAGENRYKVVNQEKPDKFAVTFKKLDEAGKALADAKFGLYKKADPVNPVKEFLTGTKDINLKLEAGEYVLRELSAPDGYVKVAEDITFKINDQEWPKQANPLMVLNLKAIRFQLLIKRKLQQKLSLSR